MSQVCFIPLIKHGYTSIFPASNRKYKRVLSKEGFICIGNVTGFGDDAVGSLVINVFSNGKEMGFSFPRNHEFVPMVTDLVEFGGGRFATVTKHSSWPSWLEIIPIPSGPSTWQQVE